MDGWTGDQAEGEVRAGGLTGPLPGCLGGVDGEGVVLVEVGLHVGHRHGRRQVGQTLPQSGPLPVEERERLSSAPLL